jgi:hypothetical protein
LHARETITVPSPDGLVITADTYIQNEDPEAPFIVLFHQAGWSRGEYRESALRLNEMGFNCMAVDQRSAGAVNGVTNETKQRAVAQGKGTGFLDAVPDMLAAIAFTRENYSDGVLIGSGSSYSSALILKLAGDELGLVDAVASFSPSEYFSPSNLIRTSAANLSVPVFITSRKSEQGDWQSIFDVIPEATGKVYFLPATSGQHGSRAQWAQFSDSEFYWDAYGAFLAQFVPSMVQYREENGLATDGSEDLLVADGGNLSHLMRHALGGGEMPEIVGEGFLFKLLKSRADLVFSVEMAETPAGNWEEIWSSETTPSDSGAAAFEEKVVPLGNTGGRRFARLRVTVGG